MELLKQLYRIYSPSRGEKKMRKFIKDWAKRNVPEASVTVDDLGNIYIRKGESDTYPTIVSHIDQVQKIHSRDFQVVETKGALLGFSRGNMRLEGLGADDKNGIWVCLKCLKKYPVMKCAFFVGEEIGCIGSEGCDMSFFSDSRYVLQCDRRGGHDLIYNIGGWTELCSEEFLDAIGYERFGYKKTTGMMTDVEALKNRGLAVSAVNMSCGYYRPHTDEEFTIIPELQGCLAFVEHIVETCTAVYPHEEQDDYYFGRWGRKGMDMELHDWIEDYLLYYPEATDEEVVAEFADCTRMDPSEIAAIAQEIRNIYYMDQPEEDEI